MQINCFLVWLFAYIFALLIGHCVVELVIKWMREGEGKGKVRKAVKPWKSGLIERLIFVPVVAFKPDAFLILGGWIGLKMAANWNRDRDSKNKNLPMFAISGLYGNLISMVFAYGGGMIIHVYGCIPH